MTTQIREPNSASQRESKCAALVIWTLKDTNSPFLNKYIIHISAYLNNHYDIQELLVRSGYDISTLISFLHIYINYKCFLSNYSGSNKLLIIAQEILFPWPQQFENMKVILITVCCLFSLASITQEDELQLCTSCFDTSFQVFLLAISCINNSF